MGFNWSQGLVACAPAIAASEMLAIVWCLQTGDGIASVPMMHLVGLCSPEVPENTLWALFHPDDHGVLCGLLDQVISSGFGVGDVRVHVGPGVFEQYGIFGSRQACECCRDLVALGFEKRAPKSPQI